MSRLSIYTRLAALATVVAAVSCSTDKNILGPDTPPGGDIFRSYVALGNSITAGYQSGGINDSTQRQSYARLLAGAMGTQYHYASLAMPGCPAPINNGLTGSRVPPVVPGGCALRSSTSVTDVLNNVAVPGANSYDPTSILGVRLFGTGLDTTANALTTFILGGKTQVGRAIDAHPTFATVWIGNNDVLQPALSGLYQPIKTSQAQFQANYDAMMKGLTDSMPTLKGVLIGVAKAQYLPSMVSGGYLYSNLAAQQTINKLVGTTVTVYPNCANSTSLVNIVSLIPAMQAFVASAGTKGHPPYIVCEKNTPGFPAPVGDVYILDSGEQVTVNAAVDAYNAYIQGKAAALGFAYFDPNTLFAPARAAGQIPAFPTYTCGTTVGSCTAVSYGPLITLDAIHPSAAAHVLIANALIDVINARYGSTLAHVTGA